MKIITFAIYYGITSFCNIAVEKRECINDVIQCYRDDIYTVNQCKTEYLTDKYGVDYVELD